MTPDNPTPTPSKEAMDAVKAFVECTGIPARFREYADECQLEVITDELAPIIDHCFAPLRDRLAKLEAALPNLTPLQLSPGFVPSYSNPDNINCAAPAEPIIVTPPANGATPWIHCNHPCEEYMKDGPDCGCRCIEVNRAAASVETPCVLDAPWYWEEEIQRSGRLSIKYVVRSRNGQAQFYVSSQLEASSLVAIAAKLAMSGDGRGLTALREENGRMNVKIEELVKNGLERQDSIEKERDTLRLRVEELEKERDEKFKTHHEQLCAAGITITALEADKRIVNFLDNLTDKSGFSVGVTEDGAVSFDWLGGRKTDLDLRSVVLAAIAATSREGGASP